MATGKFQEVLPPALGATSEPPPVFDGTTRLYINYLCPFAQRPWITRNYKGLQDTIKLVPIDLMNRPSWYKEKVYPENKVPALEHNNEVRGESLDLVKYINENFEGPHLLPDDPAKVEFAEELIAYSDKFTAAFRDALVSKQDIENQIRDVLDHLEHSLAKFYDGPFFLGQFSMVDILYVPFIERYGPLILDVWKYDIMAGRPKLVSWFEEMNKIEAYTETKYDSKALLELHKKIFGLN
ncbi:protein IN2-1 homolog B-like [Aristolochia californica]|uniref:protein IN2-1 homolog B-like n=1 Tax=Aristolochia californica TaxID=171875 RepID=UPI0035D9982A